MRSHQHPLNIHPSSIPINEAAQHPDGDATPQWCSSMAALGKGQESQQAADRQPIDALRCWPGEDTEEDRQRDPEHRHRTAPVAPRPPGVGNGQGCRVGMLPRLSPLMQKAGRRTAQVSTLRTCPWPHITVLSQPCGDTHLLPSGSSIPSHRAGTGTSGARVPPAPGAAWSTQTHWDPCQQSPGSGVQPSGSDAKPRHAKHAAGSRHHPRDRNPSPLLGRDDRKPPEKR